MYLAVIDVFEKGIGLGWMALSDIGNYVLDENKLPFAFREGFRV